MLFATWKHLGHCIPCTDTGMPCALHLSLFAHVPRSAARPMPMTEIATASASEVLSCINNVLACAMVAHSNCVSPWQRRRYRHVAAIDARRSRT